MPTAAVPGGNGTSTTLTTDTTTVLFAQAVAVTATVADSEHPAVAPGGSVTFSEGSTLLATVTLDAGRARFTTSALRPGTHRISASYIPDADHTAGATGEPAEVTAGFSRPCVTTEHRGPLTVAAGESLCIASGGSQSGPVTVRPGGPLRYEGNEPAPRVTGTTVVGPRSGQCR